MSVRQNGNIIAGSAIIKVPSISLVTAAADKIGIIYYDSSDKRYKVVKEVSSGGTTTYEWQNIVFPDDITINNGTIDSSGVVTKGTKISDFKGIIVAEDGGVEPTSIPLGYSLETYESVSP